MIRLRQSGIGHRTVDCIEINRRSVLISLCRCGYCGYPGDINTSSSSSTDNIPIMIKRSPGPPLADWPNVSIIFSDWLTDWLLVYHHPLCYCSDQSNTTVTLIELSSTRTNTIEKEIFSKYQQWLDCTNRNIFSCFSRKILWFSYQFLFLIVLSPSVLRQLCLHRDGFRA